ARVSAVNTAGDLTVDLGFGQLRRAASPAPSATLPVASPLFDALAAAFCDFRTRAVISPRGIVQSVTAQPAAPSTNPPDVRALLHAFLIPLPDEPVGAGARWQVAITSPLDNTGAHLLTVHTVTLGDLTVDQWPITTTSTITLVPAPPPR
ncbi:MAG: hypothetical protein ACK51N_06875, partial [bacterium]